MHDESLVAAKQAGYDGSGRRVNAEKLAGYVAKRNQFAGQRRMDTMVVVRREVDRRERAVTVRIHIVEIDRKQITQ